MWASPFAHLLIGLSYSSVDIWPWWEAASVLSTAGVSLRDRSFWPPRTPQRRGAGKFVEVQALVEKGRRTAREVVSC